MDIFEEIRESLSCRMKIVRAMDSLMREKPFDKLTVTGICEQAGISRQMFYKCFTGKDDVVNWLLTELTRPTVRPIGISVGWREGFVLLLRALSEYESFMRAVVRSTGPFSLPAASARLAKEHYERSVRIRLETDEIPPLLQFQIDSFAVTCTNATTMWYMGDRAESPEEYADMMVSLVPRNLFQTLDIPSSECRGWTIMGECDIDGEA